jgi:glutamate/tyrosine decarboxylase-like PLP-dependent enzyme
VNVVRAIAVMLVALGLGFATEESALAGGGGPDVAGLASSRVFDWPPGVAAWTIVLTTSGSEDGASLAARTARNDGLPQAGCIRAGTGSRPWIVFSGVLAHAATNAAERRARAAGFAHARVAFVHKNLKISYP